MLVDREEGSGRITSGRGCEEKSGDASGRVGRKWSHAIETR